MSFQGVPEEEGEHDEERNDYPGHEERVRHWEPEDAEKLLGLQDDVDAGMLRGSGGLLHRKMTRRGV